MPPSHTGSVDRCFLCCEPVSPELRSKEHFVPRCFYEGNRLPDEPGLCLPAHRDCNVSTSSDEEWVAVNLALSNPLGGRNEERWARSIRALRRPEAEGLKERLVSGIVELPGGGASLHVGSGRLIWVLAKIVKGLCWRNCGTLLGPETQWTIRQADYEQTITLEADWCVEVPANGDLTQRGAVVLAKGLGLPEKLLFNWFLIVHGQHPFFVTTVPRLRFEEGAVDDPHDCMQLAWPKAGSPRATAE
jgi:hypothetical protein